MFTVLIGKERSLAGSHHRLIDLGFDSLLAFAQYLKTRE
jgi:hypothetical protein